MSEKDEVFAKCAWRLIPFMGLLYLVNYIDRTNAGLAALTSFAAMITVLANMRLNEEKAERAGK